VAAAALVAAGALTLGAGPALAAGGGILARPGHAPRNSPARGTSTNWSGYAVDGANATQVIGTWTQPTATCMPGEKSWSSPWVGIDGDASKTVEQTGTDSDCVNGIPYYYAWYEMYPKGTVKIPLAVNPGDTITGAVSYSANAFVLALTDQTTGLSFTTTQVAKKAQRASVEWIMEGPSNALLTDFGTATFTAASATIAGQTASLGALPSPNPITMVTRKGSLPRAVPSLLSAGSFSVAWQHS
jgi:hypothetical protein